MNEAINLDRLFEGTNKVSSIFWNGIELKFEGWQAQVVRIDFAAEPEIYETLKFNLGLLAEERLDEGLIIFDGKIARLIAVRGKYGIDSRKPLQTILRLDKKDNKIIVSGAGGTKKFKDRPCGPGWEINPEKISSATFIKETGQLVLTRKRLD